MINSLEDTVTIKPYLEWMASARGNRALPEGFSYSGLEDYLIDRGHDPVNESLTRDEMHTLNAALKRCPVKRFQLRECFYNSQTLVCCSPMLQYVEGLAHGSIGFPIHHGWIELNGKVIDLTWRTGESYHRKSGPLRNRVLGEIPDEWGYYGATFHTVDVLERMVDRGATWSFLDDWEGDYELYKQPRLKENC